MKVTVQQEQFLSNKNNKTRLFQLLSKQLTVALLFETQQITTGDAHTGNVNCIIGKALTNPTIVVVG